MHKKKISLGQLENENNLARLLVEPSHTESFLYGKMTISTRSGLTL